MCGISGILNFRDKPVDERELALMNSFLKERGPDDEGYLLCADRVGLAHKRLSIVDLSPLGKQPMEDVGERCAITFNGEIYNFKSLKKDLTKAGAKFRSNSDTEVLLEGYLLWGIEELLRKIDGMFAFVLFDKIENVAYVCRDRFGKKPLYYFAGENYLKFSSDIRSISRTEKDLSLDYESIDYFLTELSVPQPKTIWKEIRQVAPAHFLTVDLKTKSVGERSFWKIDFREKLDISLEEAERLVEEELTKAVVRRIHGDVPIGAFLSGGVDSGLVTALLAENSSEPVKTFTVGLTYEKYNEAPLARRVAERYGTEHTEIILEPEDLVKVIDDLIEYCGEPFADSSLIPSFYICRSISGSVKVALSGDGGDELFGGYYDYEYAFRTDRYLKKKAAQPAVVSSLGLAANKAAFRFGLTSFNEGVAADYARFTGAERLYRHMGFAPAEKKRLYTKDFYERAGDFSTVYLQKIWDEANEVSITDTLLEASLKTRLLNDYLVKVDRASMMNSLEVRSPFLDHKLAETAARIPAEHHLHDGTTKFLTKKLAEKYIDPEVFTRAKKGFGIPLAEWIRGDLREYVRDVLFNFKAAERGIVNPDFVREIFREHAGGAGKDYTDKIWALFCLENWLEKNSV